MKDRKTPIIVPEVKVVGQEESEEELEDEIDNDSVQKEAVMDDIEWFSL